MNNDTPRTDEQDGYIGEGAVDSDFARTLERENVKLRAVLRKMYNTQNDCPCEVSNEVVEIWAEARAILFPSA